MLTLAPGISFCAVEDRLIFLDRHRDRYASLTDAGERAFRAWLSDPRCPDDAERAELLASGLIVDSAAAPASACTPPPAPQRSLLDHELPPVPARAVLASLAQLGIARMRLSLRGLDRSLSALASKKRTLTNPPNAAPSDCLKVAAAFARAGRIRSTLDTCLVHSLAVAHALAEHGIAAELVLGVRLGPFAAHCWVQYQGCVVNDQLDMVRTFTPILVV
jgi:hypothetical protein